eukprot:CAMPEP_0194041452 /NCGR_PEP_ID=MMETSP0009_2-20130614/13359_1 /TAXON_ID=210454 /ORGANISM="Grammatophora oceanica, Strain CCMP 410" /LENGTH=572 /DNA_ID=CAMNT_0038684967 /DNA_START=53 /DNA_END=1771 /DNA_ORIENTATION=+
MKLSAFVALLNLALSGTDALFLPTKSSSSSRFDRRRSRIRLHAARSKQSRHDTSNNFVPSPPTQKFEFITEWNERLLVTRELPNSSDHAGDSDYSWLYWLGKKVEENPVGKLDAKQTDQLPRVISVWSKKKTLTGAKQAQALLQRFVAEQLAGNPVAKVHVKSFNCVLSAWERTGVADATDRVQALIGFMRKLREVHPDKFGDLRGDVITYSVFAKTWAKSRDPQAVNKAMGILSIMEENDLGPNTHTYNAILQAHVHSDDVHKAVKVREIIERMNQRVKAGHTECRPDLYSYQSLIAAWSRTPLAGTAQKAETVLHFLDRVSNTTRPDLKPNVHCYTAAIHAWSHSWEYNKARRAYQILHHMRVVAEIKPTIVAYTAVLNACKSPAEDIECEHAFQVARLVMEELRWDEHVQPNFLTYATFLHVVATTTYEDSEQREKIIRVTWREACKDGQVGCIVLENLRMAASNELYQELLGPVMKPDPVDGVPVVHLPFEWGKNVKGERMPPKRYVRFSLEQPVESSVREELRQVPEDWCRGGPYSKEKQKQAIYGLEDVSFTVDEDFGIYRRGMSA